MRRKEDKKDRIIGVIIGELVPVYWCKDQSDEDVVLAIRRSRHKYYGLSASCS